MLHEKVKFLEVEKHELSVKWRKTFEIYVHSSREESLQFTDILMTVNKLRAKLVQLLSYKQGDATISLTTYSIFCHSHPVCNCNHLSRDRF